MSAPPVPRDTDAERALLGAMFLSRGAIDAACDAGIEPGDFYEPAYGRVFNAIITLAANGTAVDTVTVGSALSDNGAARYFGDDIPKFLLAVIADTPASANAASYAARVRDCADGRRILACLTTTRDAVLAHEPVDEHVEELVALASRTNGADVATSWQAVDLGAALDGQTAPPPTLLTRTDGVALLYPGRIHWFQGESETCKSWAAQHAAAQVLKAGQRVLWIDYEDDELSLVERFGAMSVTREQIRDGLVYVRPDEPLVDQHGRPTPAARDFAALLREQFALIVLDGVTEAMVTEGLDLRDNADTARFMRRLPRKLANTGAAVVCIDHVAKSAEQRGHYALGAGHKRAGLTGAAYSFKATRGLHRARGAEPVDAAVTITVEKDRPGHVPATRDDRRIAVMELVAYPDGGVTITLVPPSSGSSTPDIALQEAILGHLHVYDGASGRNIIDGVERRENDVRAALRWMAEQDPALLRIEKSGHSYLHYLTDEGRAR
jgi:hypothetical protein